MWHRCCEGQTIGSSRTRSRKKTRKPTARHNSSFRCLPEILGTLGEPALDLVGTPPNGRNLELSALLDAVSGTVRPPLLWPHPLTKTQAPCPKIRQLSPYVLCKQKRPSARSRQIFSTAHNDACGSSFMRDARNSVSTMAHLRCTLAQIDAMCLLRKCKTLWTIESESRPRRTQRSANPRARMSVWATLPGKPSGLKAARSPMSTATLPP